MLAISVMTETRYSAYGMLTMLITKGSRHACHIIWSIMVLLGTRYPVMTKKASIPSPPYKILILECALFRFC